MSTKNLTRYRKRNLTLQFGDHEYVSKPPTTETATLLIALTSTGDWAAFTDKCPTCGQATTEPPAEWTELLEANKSKDLPEIMFGKTVARQMDRRKMSDEDKTMLSMYAMWYWLYGEEAAEAFVEAAHGNDSDDDEETEPGPKDQKPSKNGPPTE